MISNSWIKRWRRNRKERWAWDGPQLLYFLCCASVPTTTTRPHSEVLIMQSIAICSPKQEGHHSFLTSKSNCYSLRGPKGSRKNWFSSPPLPWHKRRCFNKELGNCGGEQRLFTCCFVPSLMHCFPRNFMSSAAAAQTNNGLKCLMQCNKRTKSVKAAN